MYIIHMGRERERESERPGGRERERELKYVCPLSSVTRRLRVRHYLPFWHLCRHHVCLPRRSSELPMYVHIARRCPDAQHEGSGVAPYDNPETCMGQASTPDQHY